MHSQDDLPEHEAMTRPITHTEADETSETRFGPRPVPEGHRRPQQPPQSRHVPPHGRVSPDGIRVWPTPSPAAKWLVWGGTALAAAALTAGAAMAARHVVDALSGDRAAPPQPKPRRPPSQPARVSDTGGRDHLAPRFADLDAEAREAMRRRARDRDASEAARDDRLRAEARHDRTPPQPRRRAPGPSLLQEVEANTASLTQGIDNLMGALTSALGGFRTVAAQAGGIMREFGDAATLAQGLLGRGAGDQGNADRQPRAAAGDQGNADRRPRTAARPDDRHGAHMPDLRDDPLTHDPLDGPTPDEPQDHNPRLHRL